MPAIFISYRRDDTEGQAGRLYDDLVESFGKDSVFMDVTGIELGCDFRQAIQDQISSCDILLALIGREWLTSKDQSGTSRLDDPRDFVRIETAAALKREIPVIPVLIKGASMPSEDQLPADLKKLSYRNAIELTHARWGTDLIALNEAISRKTGLTRSTKGEAISKSTLSRLIKKLNPAYTAAFFSLVAISTFSFLWSPPATITRSFLMDPRKPQPGSVENLTIHKNDKVKIVLSGMEQAPWNCRGGPNHNGKWVGFGGDSSFVKDPNLTSSTSSFCSLIRRIGSDGTWKSLADDREFTADAKGELYLTVNDTKPSLCPLASKDDCYKDNLLRQSANGGESDGAKLNITVTSHCSRILRFLNKC